MQIFGNSTMLRLLDRSLPLTGRESAGSQNALNSADKPATELALLLAGVNDVELGFELTVPVLAPPDTGVATGAAFTGGGSAVIVVGFGDPVPACTTIAEAPSKPVLNTMLRPLACASMLPLPSVVIPWAPKYTFPLPETLTFVGPVVFTGVVGTGPITMFT